MSTVSTRIDGNVLVVTMDDGKVNALSFAAIEALESAINEAETNPEIGAMVLAGRPGKFCAGFDLSVIQGGDQADIIKLVSGGGGVVHRTYTANVPVVAACTGHAVAAGALLLLGCDVRIGPDDTGTKIGLNEVAIGLSLPGWALTIARDRLSRRHLQQAVATARIYGGPGAVDAGYLDETAPADQVMEVAIRRAHELATTLDARAYGATIRALRSETADQMAAQLDSDRQMAQ